MPSRSIPVVASLRTKAAPASARCLVLTAVVSVCAACDAPRLAWVDATPQRTTMPSPLAHPPFVPYDSTLADSSALAAFLLTQDLWRESGANSLLDSAVQSMPEARDPLTTTARVAPVAPGATPAGGMGADTGTATAARVDHTAHTGTPAAAAAGLGDGDVPVDAARCARSLRTVVAPGVGTLAVWWTRAPRGRVHLVGAWREQGAAVGAGAWRGPIPIDTLDQGPEDAQAAERGAHGCERPAASVTVDARTAFVHVAYAVRGPEGAGVFYAHQMDPRAAFELPIAVLYGERLGVVRVASDGDVVAVAYEDPNTRGRTRVGLAVSRTAGHAFDEARLIASADAGEARDPHVVVKGRAVVVGWSDVGAASSAGATAAGASAAGASAAGASAAGASAAGASAAGATAGASAGASASAEPTFVTRRLRVLR